MVDDLVLFGEYDDELAEGIRYIDNEARKKGMSFYDMVYKVLYQHDIKEKAKEWRENKNV